MNSREDETQSSQLIEHSSLKLSLVNGEKFTKPHTETVQNGSGPKIGLDRLLFKWYHSETGLEWIQTDAKLNLHFSGLV